MNAPLIKTTLPGPKAKAIIERDTKVVSPSYTRGYPFVMARGTGAIVEDVDGNLFLDCAAGIAVTATGHSHPDVVAAIVDQAQKFLHMSGTDFYYEQQVRLAEEFGAMAPFGGEKRSFFSNSGTEAIEAAMDKAQKKAEADAQREYDRILRSTGGRTRTSRRAESSPLEQILGSKATQSIIGSVIRGVLGNGRR